MLGVSKESPVQKKYLDLDDGGEGLSGLQYCIGRDRGRVWYAASWFYPGKTEGV